MSGDEEPFVVEHESLLINGEWYDVENATHVVVDGQEYIFLDDKMYELDDSVVGRQMMSIVRQESVYFNGEKYDLEDSPHTVISGQEYISIDGKWYELNGAFLGDEIDGDELEMMMEEDDGDDAPSYEPPPQLYAPPPQSEGESILVSALSFIISLGIVALIAFAVFSIGMVFLSGIPLDAGGSGVSAPSVVAAGTVTPQVTSAIVSVTRTPTLRATPTPVISYWDAKASSMVDAMDYTNPTTRDFAVSLIDQSHGGQYNIAQICDMWEKSFKKWTYVNDPSGSEYYSPASRTIKNGLKGDCDDFAILIASVVMATGGSARIISAKNTDGPGHAYAEVYMSSNEADIQKIADHICKRYNCKGIAYRISNEGGQTRYWLNLDWQATHPGGPYFQNNGETVAIYPNGHWVRLLK